MRLTEIAVDGFGSCINLRLENLSGGLNWISDASETRRRELTEYVRSVLFGFAGQIASGHGSLEAEIHSQSRRLTRNVDSGRQLVVSDLQGSLPSAVDRESVLSVLNKIGADVFERVHVLNRSDDRYAHSQLAEIAERSLGVPVGRDAMGNTQRYHEVQRSVETLGAELRNLESQITRLNDERREIDARLRQQSNDAQNRQISLENQIGQLKAELDSSNAVRRQQEIDRLDRVISDTRLQIESVEENIEFVSRPARKTGDPASLYQRLDDLDQQIGRWRRIHSDVQQQRVTLKDELVELNRLSVDSTEHPYHRAQSILQNIESRVGLTESAVQQFNTANQDPNQTARRITELCGEIRAELYTLCDELGGQYRNVRQRSAAAELKRLRRCYDEISQNLDIMIQQRHDLLANIREVDPVGAEAIVQAEAEFCACAQHEGFLAARRRFVGEFRNEVEPATTSIPNIDELRVRLATLQDSRDAVMRELVELENRRTGIAAQLKSLTNELASSRPAQINSELSERSRSIEIELQQLQERQREVRDVIDRDNRVSLQPANPIIVGAGEYARLLTEGRIQQIWIERLSASRSGEQLTLRAAGADGIALDEQQMSIFADQIGLAMRLAIANGLRESGQQLPVMVDVELAGWTGQTLDRGVESLLQFCTAGNQVLLMSDADSGIEHRSRPEVTVFDLPDTFVRPDSPYWVPDRTFESLPREPEFLTPFTTRYHASAEALRTYPQVKYPTTGHLIDHSVEQFETETLPFQQYQAAASLPDTYVHSADRPSGQVVVTAPTVSVTLQSQLHSLGIFESGQLQRLQQAGIESVAQLLDLNPENLPLVLLDNHLTSQQLDRWQSQAWLMVCVPELHQIDTVVLCEIGITEPEQLDNSTGQQLLERIQRFLGTTEGQRTTATASRYNRETINRWYSSLASTRDRWRTGSGYSRRSRWNSRRQPIAGRESRSPQIRNWRPTVRNESRSSRSRSANRSHSSENSLGRTGETASRQKPMPAETTRLKFYLELQDKLEAAPSIGPKTAERFERIDVVTVSDFLAKTAEAMARKINYKRITADVIRQWQNQARMVCRIPNLRGHDAQLLVACGIIEPEDLAGRQPKSLLAIIEPFAASKEGLKIIRGGKQPDLAEITDWIEWARQTRSLQAA